MNLDRQLEAVQRYYIRYVLILQQPFLKKGSMKNFIFCIFKLNLYVELKNKENKFCLGWVAIHSFLSTAMYRAQE